MKKMFVMFDGTELDPVDFAFLNRYLIDQGKDIFAVYQGKLRLKFVGFIEFVIDDINYQLYCFPKEYELVLKTKVIITNQELVLNDEEQNLFKTEFRAVITTIQKTKAKQAAQSAEDNGGFYLSNLYYLQAIINHQQQYGSLMEVAKTSKRSSNGKISWQKTISKVIPKITNQNSVYDQFIVTHKHHEISFLSKLVAKVIFEGTRKYDFYVRQLDLEIDYHELNEFSTSGLIEQLYAMKNRCFKDYLHQIIDYLIAYLSNELKENQTGIIMGTSKYELVWEEIVALYLILNYPSHQYNTQVKRAVHNVNSEKQYHIIIDHLDWQNKALVDSKYYSDRESDSLDYKQLFYNYFLIYETYFSTLDEQMINYQDIQSEYASWSNTLIRPTIANAEQAEVKMRDGLCLRTHKINMRDNLQAYARISE